MEHQHRLGPIVFDEIHKMITDSSYRDVFQNFHALNTVKAVIFGLTGSLPPSLYTVLCEMTATTWHILRTPSSRKELKYQVLRVGSEGDMDASIVEHLKQSMKGYQPNDRAIVFCRTRNQVTTLAKLFKTHPFQSAGEDRDFLQKNQEALINWVSGEKPVMTSTSILGCGIDYPNIRDVIHRHPSFSMIDQYQEDSRGGRDGLECRATTFVVDKKTYKVPLDQQYDLGTQCLFDSMFETQQCRRMAPTLYLDGRALQCMNLVGAVFCDFCEKSSTIVAQETLPAFEHIPILEKFSPPSRSFDLFDSSPTVELPRIDFRNIVRPTKRTRSDESSRSGLSSGVHSSSKRVKISETLSFFPYL